MGHSEIYKTSLEFVFSVVWTRESFKTDRVKFPFVGSTEDFTEEPFAAKRKGETWDCLRWEDSRIKLNAWDCFFLDPFFLSRLLSGVLCMSTCEKYKWACWQSQIHKKIKIVGLLIMLQGQTKNVSFPSQSHWRIDIGISWKFCS